MNLIPMSRSEVDVLRKEECLQLMEHLGEAQPRRGVLVVELKAMLKDLLFSKKENRKNRSWDSHGRQRASSWTRHERQLQIPVSEKHTRRTLDQDYVGRLYAVDQGLGKHGAKTYEEVLKWMTHPLPRSVAPTGDSTKENSNRETCWINTLN